MAYIKKLVMHGFKSFAKRTEIFFDNGINVVLGPNGSGKSNVSDALCFVLGRLSIKSMRAAKSKNLLFMGSKYVKPAHEATVELVFDNTDRAFSIDTGEITLQRTVRSNGQGIYKINGETKTRLEVVEMLAQAGIDPYGFNLVLQGQIQAIVKMHPEERRKVIEEVAGIAIYESRKEKSLKELEKTEERLKEIGAILRERTAYLKNLDTERQQALKHQELELIMRRCTSSLLHKRKNEKVKEMGSVDHSISEKNKQREGLREKANTLQEAMDALGELSNTITRQVQKATGLEQESLHAHIANLRAELEGHKVRKENFEHRKQEAERRIEEVKKTLPSMEAGIRALEQESPVVAQKAHELQKKKEELSLLEEDRKKAHTLKAELQSCKERLLDKERQLSRGAATSESLVRQIEESTGALRFTSEEQCQRALGEMHEKLEQNKKEFEQLQEMLLAHEKNISVAEANSARARQVELQVSKIDICPLCRTAITAEHKQHVTQDAQNTITKAEQEKRASAEQIQTTREKRTRVQQSVRELEIAIQHAEIELIRHKAVHEKKNQLKKLIEEEKLIKNELHQLEQRRMALEQKTVNSGLLEEQYDQKLLEIEEISSRSAQDVDTTLLWKRRELEGAQNIIKRASKDTEELEKELASLSMQIEAKRTSLSEKELQEKQLQERFKQLFADREKAQRELQERSIELSELQSEIRALDEQINYLKIGKAKLDAEREAIEMELIDFSGVELLDGSQHYLEERRQKAQEQLQHIGSINMRALEVYEEVKVSYDEVALKVQTVEKEKLEIMTIIAEIDKKKKLSFMKTYRAMNELFTSNFAQLYTKGTAYLELENQEDIFAGGVQIVVRLAKGKYFDVTSLSGGEQTLVALSLLFAIQEYKPYHFYVFDEIDAALDKRNSERLAALLNRYMKAGQYIVITHNDAIIMNANVLYGVSMHDNVSKVLSLNLKEAEETARQIEQHEAEQQKKATMLPETNPVNTS